MSRLLAAECRGWAREQLVGVQNMTFPSFSPDLSALDETGIRWDVNQAKRHGFRATLAVCEVGLSFDEAKRFVQIVVDEAGEDLLVSVTLLFDSMEQNLAMARWAEKVGAHLLQVGLPHNFYPRDAAEVEGAMRSLVEATALPVVLYPSPHFNLERMHPSGFPQDVLERLSDLPNVVAVEGGHATVASEFVYRFRDKLLIINPVESLLPLMVQAVDMQFMGPGCYEAYQSPDKPYVVDYFRLLREGNSSEAMDIYWRLMPARGLFESKMAATAMLGCYHWPLQKYYQWLVGGNGGYTRQPCMKLHQHEMEPLRFALMALGIQGRQPDAEFYVGRSNYDGPMEPAMPPEMPPGMPQA